MPKPLLLVAIILLLMASSVLPEAVSIGKPGCKTQCGNVSIPYPFGIGDHVGCYFDEWYQIECRNWTGNDTPFLKKNNMEVLNISNILKELKVKYPIKFSNCKQAAAIHSEASNLTESPYIYSQKRNRFTSFSCGKVTNMLSEPNKTTIAACMSICEKISTAQGSCNGMDCCQTTIPSDLLVFSIDFNINFDRHPKCRYAFLVDQEWFEFRSKRYDDINSGMIDSVPVVLEWILLYNDLGVKEFGNFPDRLGKSKTASSSTSYCERDSTTSSIFNYTRINCSCREGFEGNPYLSDGCHGTKISSPVQLIFNFYIYLEVLLIFGSADIDECENPPDDCEDRTCLNLPGGYKCHKKKIKNPTIKRVLQGMLLLLFILF